LTEARADQPGTQCEPVTGFTSHTRPLQHDGGRTGLQVSPERRQIGSGLGVGIGDGDGRGDGVGLGLGDGVGEGVGLCVGRGDGVGSAAGLMQMPHCSVSGSQPPASTHTPGHGA
jgi:hypothetical protein